MKLVKGMAAFSDRGAGTDAERRAAAWLADQLSSGQQDALVETFWCRPNWGLAHAVHATLAIAGSLASLLSPVAGVAILAVALGSLLADWLTGLSVGRLLTREHASQNVVLGPAPVEGSDEKSVRLIICANYDASRVGLVYRDWLRRSVAAIRQTFRAWTPGWLGWTAVAVAWLLAIAILRLEGERSEVVGLAQLPPTAGLLIGVALLLELAVARWSPAREDNASAVTVAVTVARALESTPPQHLDVELVLTGASDGDQTGLRQYLRSRRGERRADNTVVLGIAPCAAGQLHWWYSDGALIPLRFSRQLRELAVEIAAEEPYLQATRFKGRGATPAFPARLAGVSAIALGCLNDRGLAPISHQPGDTADAVDASALDTAVQFAVLIVDGIDAAIGELRDQAAATAA